MLFSRGEKKEASLISRNFGGECWKIWEITIGSDRIKVSPWLADSPEKL